MTELRLVGGEATLVAKLSFTPALIDAVDDSIDPDFTVFRTQELDHLKQHHGLLYHLITDRFFAHSRQRYSEDESFAFMAGNLFASRALRFAADKAGTRLPPLDDGALVQKAEEVLARFINPDTNNIDFGKFAEELPGQIALIDRIERLKHPVARDGAAVIVLMHADMIDTTMPTNFEQA